jgi:hypothetical protein
MMQAPLLLNFLLPFAGIGAKSPCSTAVSQNM